MKDCLKCHGKGTYDRPTFSLFSAIFEDLTKTCEYCKGTGRVADNIVYSDRRILGSGYAIACTSCGRKYDYYGGDSHLDKNYCDHCGARL